MSLGPKLLMKHMSWPLLSGNLRIVITILEFVILHIENDSKFTSVQNSLT